MDIKKIRLLHLYHDLMNLYGDWANIAVLERELFSRGYDVSVDKKSVGDEIAFGLYDFIYIGSGTERSQKACMSDLMRFREAFIERIEAGIPVLATGNSHELYGKTVTDSDNKKHKMLGLLDLETVQLNTRITGDCTCIPKAPLCRDKLIGFINRAGGSQSGDIRRPFSISPGEGAGFKACDEGIIYNNLLGTYITGPILVRNPPLMKYFADIIAGEDTKAKRSEGNLFFMYQDMAYRTALEEL